MTRTIGRRARVAAIGCGAVVALLAGCGSEQADRDDGDGSSSRSQLTVTLRDTSMDAPTRIAGGLVDVTLHAEPGKLPHHVAFFRLDEGVDYDELLATPEGQDLGMFTFQGGHGTLLPGETAHLTLDLPPGTYAVRDLGEVNLSSAKMIVDGVQSTDEPASRGTVHLGPGMAIHVPADFTARGVWKFTNDDTTMPHEAALIRLAPGKTVDDLVRWASTFDGPPPGDFIGGFGALGPGVSGWLDFEDALDDGEYVLACFIPGATGMMHVASGMAVSVRP